MKRCQHLNVTIWEEFMAHSFFEFENGVSSYNDHTPEGGYYTGMMNVKCRDCGYEGRFNRFHKKNPAWLVRLLDQLIETKEAR